MGVRKMGGWGGEGKGKCTVLTWSLVSGGGPVIRERGKGVRGFGWLVQRWKVSPEMASYQGACGSGEVLISCLRGFFSFLWTKSGIGLAVDIRSLSLGSGTW